jgi:hypothetical protein
MRRLILYCALTLTLLACKKDQSEPRSLENNHASFLAQTEPAFQGKFNENPFSWKSGWNQFQRGYVYTPMPDGQDTSELVRVIASELISWGSNLRWSMLHTPKYNSGSESEVVKVFSVGKKNLGDYISDYHLEIFTNGVLYKSARFKTTNAIEVLKAKESNDDLGKKILLWMKISGVLKSSNGNDSLTLNEGLMIAEFYRFKD